MSGDATSRDSGEKNRVLKYFETEVEQYLLPDILRLTNEIRPDSDTRLRGCTVPLAMMLFAVMDLFGYLIRNAKKPRKDDTLANFRYLLSTQAQLFPPEYGARSELIVKLFRNGLMHQVFPKASGISKAGPDKPLLYKGSGKPILNVDVLSRDVVAALQKLRERVASDEPGSGLAARINSRLDSLAKADCNTLNRLRSRGAV